jgi:hypothetical protein
MRKAPNRVGAANSRRARQLGHCGSSFLTVAFRGLHFEVTLRRLWMTSHVGPLRAKARLLQFIETGALDPERFQAIISRHSLVELWKRFEKQFLSDTP